MVGNVACSHRAQFFKSIHMIIYYFAENVSHFFSADKNDYYHTEQATLTCSGNVDIPEFTGITISKENVTLLQSESNMVQFSTNSIVKSVNQYGLYTCIMNARNEVKFTQRVHINNKGKTLKKC